MQKLQDKRTLIIFLLVVLGFVLFLWLVLPSHITVSVPTSEAELIQEVKQEGQEHFDGIQQEANLKGKEEQISKQVVSNDAPFVDPRTGSLIDGPGFERGEIDGISQETLSTIPSNYYFLDDGAGGELGVHFNLCSKSCCSEQWPTPFKQKYDPYVCGNKDKFVPSNIFCSNSFQDSGCLCLTKKQATNLYNRGGNGREWF